MFSVPGSARSKFPDLFSRQCDFLARNLVQRIGVGWLSWELTHQTAWVGSFRWRSYCP